MRVELRGVGKRFGRVVALQGVSLDVPAGAKLALIGPNGSGKTTLTRVIMGVLAHDGEVRLDGRPAFADRAQLAQRLAYVPQVAPAMAASVGELARAIVAVRGLSYARVRELAGELGLPLDAIAGRPFRSLSGGMKQKLSIALALSAEASLLILDEPTASLDAATRTRFFELYRRHAAGATLLLCSHRLEEIRHLVDHVVALEDGRVVHDGPAEAYLAARSGAVLELQLEAGEQPWARANGFQPGAAGWWTRSVTQAEKLRLLPEALAALGGLLRNVCVRDLDTLEVRHARE